MTNNELLFSENNKLELKDIKIIDIDKVNDNYLFIILENGQKILTNGHDLYDVSIYNHLSDMFNMGDRFCAVMTQEYSISVVDLVTMEVLFEDEKAYHISKQDDRTLHVIMKIGNGNARIYDIETQKYLPAPDDYVFENSLGNNLYVFRQPHNFDTNFYDYKRCVINADGKILLKNIDGWIELSDNYLVISKKNKLYVVKINKDRILEMKTIEQNEKIIAKPTYHNGKLIVMGKGVIKIYTPNFLLVNEFFIDELVEVIDYEIVLDILKLCLSQSSNGKQIKKHLFINLTTGKSISHFRIDGYPYWGPTTYIGYDNIDSKIHDYHFYNANFDLITKVSANDYESVESNKECMFILRTLDGENEHKQLLNTENGNIKEIDYDYIHFHLSLPYGYGVNLSTQKMDFFDENLNIVIPNFDYKKFNMSYFHETFGYFIINDYICVNNHFVGDFGQSLWRTIIQKANGQIILDSVQHKCFPMGNFIQILHNEDSDFLNTITGEIGSLRITARLDETGKIDFKTVNNVNHILSIENYIPLGLQQLKKIKHQ